MGTARYMAPEQIEGREVDERSDLFSFGAVMFEMLTGERAFVGDNPITVRAAILHHEPPAVSSCQPQVPAAIDDVVRRCLSKHPAERWQSASEVIAALRPILDSTIEAAVSGPRPNGTMATTTCADICRRHSLSQYSPRSAPGRSRRDSFAGRRGPVPARFDRLPCSRSRVCRTIPTRSTLPTARRSG